MFRHCLGNPLVDRFFFVLNVLCQVGPWDAANAQHPRAFSCGPSGADHFQLSTLNDLSMGDLKGA